MTLLRTFTAYAAGLLLAGSALAADSAVPQSQLEITRSFAPVVKKTAPAVVNIYTKTRVKVRENLSPFMNDPLFRQFFGQAMPGRTREQVSSSLGSGVIIKSDGMIVTSHHVIKDAQEIKIALADKREFEAKVVMRDPQSDLAFLKIDSPTPLPALEMRDSDTLEVGDLVLAVGNPFGIGQTVTQGIISALARKASGVSDYQFFIQTDAAINPGNSGGALVDIEGRLIGINTAIYSTTGASNGIGFAIPSNMVRALISSKVEGGKVVRPWLGLSVQPMTGELADSLGLAAPQGVLVNRIWAGSPAEKAGIKTGDVILTAGGGSIASEQDLHYRVTLAKIGEKSEFKLLRGGKEQTASVEMIAPPESPARDLRTLKGRQPLAGITVANLSPAVAIELGLDELNQTGVIVVAGGQGGSISFTPGDLILEVNGSKIASTAQLETLLAAPARSWEIVYERGGKTMTLTVRM